MRIVPQQMIRTWKAPRCDHLDVGLEAVESELKADLVIALPSATMRHETTSMRSEEKRGDNLTYSQPSLSAIAIIPRAITGRAREVPRRYTF